MKSLKDLYRIGFGPSSSHTIGPSRIAEFIKNKYKDAKLIEVTLFGSLALTGRGHLTEVTIKNVLKPIKTIINFDINTRVKHPNTLKFDITLANNKKVSKIAVSPGGGSIKILGDVEEKELEIYPEKDFKDIKTTCLKNNWTLCDYVEHYEGKEIFKYLEKVYQVMMDSINRGISTEGFLPGKLHVKRKAKMFFDRKIKNKSDDTYLALLGYSFAVGEENASGGLVVTAPTCGAAATLPAVIKYLSDIKKVSKKKIVESLAVAGVIGNVIKQNGSISGAEAGCQAEIGTASSMAAAAFSYLSGGNLTQIESSAEIAMEHSLGLTCDPVMGYVQIPCIERNAIAANRAITSARLADVISHVGKVSFDEIVKTMFKTGKDLRNEYRETSKGGLAKELSKKQK